MSDTGVILSKEVATVRCEVILTNMCSSVLMEHGDKLAVFVICDRVVQTPSITQVQSVGQHLCAIHSIQVYYNR